MLSSWIELLNCTVSTWPWVKVPVFPAMGINHLIALSGCRLGEAEVKRLMYAQIPHSKYGWGWKAENVIYDKTVCWLHSSWEKTAQRELAFFLSPDPFHFLLACIFFLNLLFPSFYCLPSPPVLYSPHLSNSVLPFITSPLSPLSVSAECSSWSSIIRFFSLL